MTSNTYSFGDSDHAAARLKKVAEVFAPEMRRFLADSAPRRPSVAVDVGCGPGYTTRLLGEVTQPESLYGVDFSEQFIESAAANDSGKAQFFRHDVTSGRLPVDQADVIFCHLLLTHIADPVATLALWAGNLAPGGVILVDETEAIDTADPVLSEYLALVDTAVGKRGGELYMGSTLANLVSVPGLVVRSSQPVKHEVSMTDAASMFFLNLETLREDPAVKKAFDASTIDQIAKDLAERRNTRRSEAVTWTMRQMVFEAA